MLGVARASYHRRSRPVYGPRRPRPTPVRALSGAERAEVLATLDSDSYADKAPAQVYAQLLDEKKYLCSTRTMYRVLDAHAQVRERRAQRSHPAYVKPQLVATGPNQVWTWDITKLAGPRHGGYFSFYVVIDLYSRFIVAWTVATTESAQLAQAMLEDAYRRHEIAPGQLTITPTAAPR
jgi:putative transposase